jgi:hypothetical protein
MHYAGGCEGKGMRMIACVGGRGRGDGVAQGAQYRARLQAKRPTPPPLTRASLWLPPPRGSQSERQPGTRHTPPALSHAASTPHLPSVSTTTPLRELVGTNRNHTLEPTWPYRVFCTHTAGRATPGRGRVAGWVLRQLPEAPGGTTARGRTRRVPLPMATLVLFHTLTPLKEAGECFQTQTGRG